ncbi:uncharacterized protein LOC118761840 [Octopus sinensis]|uniref:Uncharacterized protein LOC118761840 n=1 Tax=Octopus sinensis TaxID=2607531 RepID=A0A7E6EJU9_9MOLL|nr:uncharacterized protein LOC118761840 [Octopus sinensis]
MNLKGMETSIQYHLILLLLPYLTLVFSVTPVIGQSTYRESQFRKLTTKCLTDQNKTTEKASSRLECSILCISRDECEYFTYCNGRCYMHRLFHDKYIEDYDCNCSSYISAKGNDKGWQKVFEVTENSFTRNLIYLYWDKFPIEKVEFRLKRSIDYVITFNGIGTNSTSWFQKDKIISESHPTWYPVQFIFHENFSNLSIKIVYANNRWTDVKRKSGNEEKYDFSHKDEVGSK